MNTRGILAGLAAAAALAVAGCTATTGGTPSASRVATAAQTGAQTATSGAPTGPRTGPTGPTVPPHVPPAQVIDDAELVAIQTQTAGPRGWRGFNRFVEDGPWRAYLASLAGRDGTPHPIAATVPSVPEGKVLVAGVVATGCDPATGAILVTDGSSYGLVPTGLPDRATPECVAPFITVAVMAAPPAAVPPGSVGPGQQVHFQRLDLTSPYRPGAVELTGHPERLSGILPSGSTPPTLPAESDGLRRFAFLITACRGEAAALAISDTAVSARIDPAEADPVECVVANPFLAVFDVRAALVPPEARPTV